MNNHKTDFSQNTLKIDSLNKFAILIGIPREKLEELAESAYSYYKPFKNKKKRNFDNPTGLLKEVQSRITNRLLAKITFPNFVIGGIKGRSPLEHPQRHTNKKVVVTIDVKGCFPNLTSSQIFNVWVKQLECSHDIAHLATKLTSFKGHLPVGAPTSNYLANLALLPCVSKVVVIAESLGFENHVSQYMDDLAFSGDNLDNTFITKIVKEFSRYGFKIGRKKIFVMRRNEPQMVIGKIVNQKASIPLTKRKKIRAALFQLSRMKTEDPNYGKCYRKVRGRIEEVKQFHPKLAKEMLEKFKRLTPSHNLTHKPF